MKYLFAAFTVASILILALALGQIHQQNKLILYGQNSMRDSLQLMQRHNRQTYKVQPDAGHAVN